MWQVLMLENFDFKYEMQYKNSFDTAVQDLQRASVQPGNDAWENFLWVLFWVLMRFMSCEKKIF